MADFEAHREEFTEHGTSIIAGSSDPEEGARKAIEEWGLRFPVLYGLDPEETSRKIGCYTGERDGKRHIQPAGFVLDERGNVTLAVYSTGRVGRLTAQDALAAIGDLQTVSG